MQAVRLDHDSQMTVGPNCMQSLPDWQASALVGWPRLLGAGPAQPRRNQGDMFPVIPPFRRSREIPVPAVPVIG